MRWEYTEDDLRLPILSGASFDFKRMEDSFFDWCSFPARSLLWNRITGELMNVQDCRRGNSKFAWKNRQVMESVSGAIEQNVVIDDCEEGARSCNSCGLFITLNFNPHELQLHESWLIKSASLRYFKAALSSVLRKRKLDPHFVSYHVAEAHKSGYCHIHLFVILEQMLPVHLKQSRQGSRPLPVSHWRLDDYKLVLALKRAWSRSVYHALCRLRELPYSKTDPVAERYAFNDIQAVVGGDVTGEEDKQRTGVVGYLLKYLSKAPKLRDRKALLTLALQKIFNVRSIFGRKFLLRVGLGLKFIRHDSLKNELQQLKTAWSRAREDLGSISYAGSLPDRILSYAWAIKKGVIPPEVVEWRQERNLPFSVYERFPIENIHLEKVAPAWSFVFHARYYSQEEACEADKAFSQWVVPIGENYRSIISTARTRKKFICMEGKTIYEALKVIVCSEGMDEFSPDYFSFLE